MNFRIFILIDKPYVLLVENNDSINIILDLYHGDFQIL